MSSNGVVIGTFDVSTKEEGRVKVDGWDYRLNRWIDRHSGEWVGWHISKRTARGYSSMRGQPYGEGFPTIDAAVAFIRSKDRRGEGDDRG